MSEASFEADRDERRSGAIEGLTVAGQFEGKGNVFDGGHRRHEVEVLENDADMIATESGKFVLAQRADLKAGSVDGAGSRPLG